MQKSRGAIWEDMKKKQLEVLDPEVFLAHFPFYLCWLGTEHGVKSFPVVQTDEV